MYVVGVWLDTLARWKREGLPADVQDVHDYLKVDHLRLVNVSGAVGLFPRFETRVVREDAGEKVFIDDWGRTVRDLKNRTTMPEWLDFAVKTRTDLQMVLDRHFTMDMDRRFTPEWEAKIKADVAGQPDALVLIDGGCLYGTLRNLAGVEHTSYLLLEEPDLAHELFERYAEVNREAIRRASKLVKIDALGYGEDIAYKNGTLISPAMFRKFLLPRYRQTIELARQCGIELTWYDSDGDIRLFMKDYFSIGINTFAPCEVAAHMIPVELRRAYGKEIRLIGGIDKREIAKGRAAIDAEIARNRPVIREGGFLPAIDHSVPAEISYDDYRYFLDALQREL